MNGAHSPQCKVVVLISGSGSNLQALIDSSASADSPAQGEADTLIAPDRVAFNV